MRRASGRAIRRAAQDEQRGGDRRQCDQRQRLQHQQTVGAVRERVAALGGAGVDQRVKRSIAAMIAPFCAW